MISSDSQTVICRQGDKERGLGAMRVKPVLSHSNLERAGGEVALKRITPQDYWRSTRNQDCMGRRLSQVCLGKTALKKIQSNWQNCGHGGTCCVEEGQLSIFLVEALPF